jgi:hypothetical protein
MSIAVFMTAPLHGGLMFLVILFAYVRQALDNKASKIIAKGETLSNKLNPVTHPELEFPY